MDLEQQLTQLSYPQKQRLAYIDFKLLWGMLLVPELVQAIMNNNMVRVMYSSLSSGSGEQKIVPHTIVDNGLWWHIRAYERKTKSFRGFILSKSPK